MVQGEHALQRSPSYTYTGDGGVLGPLVGKPLCLADTS